MIQTTELKDLIKKVQKNYENLDIESKALNAPEFDDELKEINSLYWSAFNEPNEKIRKKKLEDLSIVAPALQERVDRFNAYKMVVDKKADRYKEAERLAGILKGYAPLEEAVQNGH